jgi:hypothetical protein
VPKQFKLSIPGDPSDESLQPQRKGGQNMEWEHTCPGDAAGMYKIPGYLHVVPVPLMSQGMLTAASPKLSRTPDAP